MTSEPDDVVELACAPEPEKLSGVLSLADRYKLTRYRCANGHEWEDFHATTVTTADGKTKIVCLSCVADFLPEVVVV